jgi:hypothetical protein
MNERFNKVNGYFKIECIDKNGNVVDTFEQKNLIMDKARETFANMLAGISGTPVIDRFVLGTEGHITGDLLSPKTEVNGFTSDRSMLFSEATGSEGINFESLYFTVTGTSTDEVVCDDNLSTVKTSVAGTDVIYEINVHNDSANATGTAAFTECAFYCGSEIFSMRTFKGKIKDDSVSLRITWKILF